MKILIALSLVFSSFVNAAWVLRDNNNAVVAQEYIAICHSYYAETINDRSSDTERQMQEMYNFHYFRTTEIGLEFEPITVNFSNATSKKLVKEICARMYFLNEAEYLFNEYLETGK